ncbi:MAG TPA: hypothetical protein VNZ57_01645 [Longimicrobiales bacterium]|nr:hypothetical protein [Longimicrobiales bacterium]
MTRTATWSRHGILLAAIVIAAACTNPYADDDSHEHADGVRVEHLGTTLVTVHEDEVTGSLSVAAGDTLGPLTVVFTDHHGEPIEVSAGYWMRPALAGSAAAFEQAEVGAFSGSLVGITPGQAELRFELLHGAVGHGHLEYRSAPIPVVVTE